ncbi:MAG TPA: SprB repeat-containing protein [Ohtaekwangia sp.]|uniref:SprB repeat-containing protein n=1 Tax=Ohtaekwangia sp. TaxID=2066019 RepID=UPI002F94249D
MVRKVNFASAVVLAVLFWRCTNHVEVATVDCSLNPTAIAVESTTNPTSCESFDGAITVTGSGGETPYQYSIDGGVTFQSSGAFTGLGGGTFIVTLKDSKGCESQTESTLTIQGSDLAATYEATADSECLSDNGTITINATGSHTPFQYRVGSGSFVSDGTFTGLGEGTYSITVKDAEGCSLAISATVAHGNTGITWSNDIKTIIDANCAVSGCHVSGGQSPNFTNFSNVQKNASLIKSRTGSRSMPPDGRTITQDQINLISCWVTDGALQN